MNGNDKENIPPQQNQANLPSRGGAAARAPLRPTRVAPAVTVLAGIARPAGQGQFQTPALAPRSALSTLATGTRASTASSGQADATRSAANVTTPVNIFVAVNTTPTPPQAGAPPSTANATTPSNSIAPASAPATTTQSTPGVKIYSQQAHAKDSKRKHAPIAPRGTIILMSDNPDLEITPFKKNRVEPTKLKLKLKDTKGNIHNRFFPDKDEMKWNDPKWISEANKWRNQVIRRMLKHDPQYTNRSIRVKWGVREATALMSELQNKIEEVGNHRLTRAEWQALTEEHNRRFASMKIKVGDELVGGQRAKSTQHIGARTVVAIKALFERNEVLKAFYNKTLADTDSGKGAAKVADIAATFSGDVDIDEEEMFWKSEDGMELDDEDEGEDESEEGSAEKSRGDRHGGVIEPRLEEPSDDEDEGQRPASTQNGARLFSCA